MTNSTLQNAACDSYKTVVSVGSAASTLCPLAGAVGATYYYHTTDGGKWYWYVGAFLLGGFGGGLVGYGADALLTASVPASCR